MTEDLRSRVMDAITDVWDHCAHIDRTTDYVMEMIHDEIPKQADDFIPSVKKLCFIARTSGGTAGHDKALSMALDRVEAMLEAQDDPDWQRGATQPSIAFAGLAVVADPATGEYVPVAPADRFCQECDGSGWDGESRKILCPKCKGSGLPVFPAVSELQRQKIISEFLERTGQYITNDASRQAAIDHALAATISAHRHELNDLQTLAPITLTEESAIQRLQDINVKIYEFLGNAHSSRDCFTESNTMGATVPVQWVGGVGLLWDVYAFGKWQKRIVSPLNWDAHSIYLNMQRAGYSKEIELRLVSSSNNANPDAPTPPASAADVVIVPHELADRVSDALGRFTGDEGWGQADMDTADEFAAIAAAKAAK